MKNKKITKSIKDFKNAKLKGLCVNCDNRNDCMYLSNNQTVIYCEEYL